MTVTTAPAFAGSERQAAFALDILTELHGSREAAENAFAVSVAGGRMATRAQVSEGIDFLLAVRAEHRAARQAIATVLVVEPGYVYYSAQGITRVVKAKTTGNVYAERLDAETGKFVYTRGAIRQLEADSTARKMTLDEAKRESVLFGQCMRCSAKLKPAKDGSQRFIGPVCETYFA